MFAICDGAQALPLVPARGLQARLRRRRRAEHRWYGRVFARPARPRARGAGARRRGARSGARRARAARAPFIGLLYAGLMLTEDGPRVLEFNCRFGDPETQAILPLLEGDLLDLLAAAARAILGRPARLGGRGAAVTVVLAADRYPAEGDRGGTIEGVDEAEATGALVFHAGTALARRAPRDERRPDPRRHGPRAGARGMRGRRPRRRRGIGSRSPACASGSTSPRRRRGPVRRSAES